MLIVDVYVDDLVLTQNKDIIFRVKSQLADTFKMTNLGILHFFLGLQVLPFSDGLSISWSKYVLDLLKRFKMDDYKAFAMPFQLVVKLAKDCESP